MTTPTREELLKLAKEAGSEFVFDSIEFTDQELERFAALHAEWLSAHQAQGEPQGWREFIEQCAATDGGMVSGNQLSMRAKLLLSAAPPSSAQTDQPTASELKLRLADMCREYEKLAVKCDQVRNEAVEAAAAQVLTFSRRKGDLCSIIAGEVLSLKRPLQAQEPASPAAQSGAVELPPLPEPDAIGRSGLYTQYTPRKVLNYARAAVELSRAQTAPVSEQPAAQTAVVPLGVIKSWNPLEGLFVVSQAHKTNGYPDPGIGSHVYAAPQPVAEQVGELKTHQQHWDEWHPQAAQAKESGNE